VVNKEYEKYNIIERKEPTFYFIGVTTGKSSINKLFSLWMKELAHPEVKLVGIDLKIHDEKDAYRQATAQIKFDENSLGALVTTHKMDLFEAAEDMFNWFDSYSKLLHEVSCISKRNGKLIGHAKDPISAGLTMDSILGPNYFQNNYAHVLIFGAGGGSSIATVLHLINKKNIGDKPKKIIVVNRSSPRLEHLKKVVNKVGTDIDMEYIQNEDPKKNDIIMLRLPEKSLVINATGLGKDRPGSPVTDGGLFPRNGIAWDFNYRGELNFLHQAKRQSKSREVRVEDGWVYFIHGWTQVIFEALHLEITEELFNRFVNIANNFR